MPLLSVFHLAILIAQFSFFLIKLSLGDLPERVDLVALELKVVPLLSLPVQLFSQSGDMLFQLLSHIRQ
jgi:hypothetical protein